MSWLVHYELDYGRGCTTEYDARYTTEGYRLVQEAAFQACRKPGNGAIVSIRASNGEGMTLILEEMHWSIEAMHQFREVDHLATEMYNKEALR